MISENSDVNWDLLDVDEQRVLFSAIEREYLIFLHLRHMPTEELLTPNRGYLYVPALMSAAKRLVDQGLAAVVPTQRPGPPLEMPREDALAVLSDFNNWWRFDPSDVSTEPKHNPIPGGLPPISVLDEPPYQLTDTNHGLHRVLNWAVPPRMPLTMSLS